MLNVSVLLAFIPAAFMLIISPGPDSIFTLTRAISDGRSAGVMAALGTSTGSIIHTTAAVVGLSALLQQSALAFTLVKFVGAGYLIYTGVQTLRSDEKFDLTPESDGYTPIQSFRSALLINVLNPKVALFFLAFLPQFVRTDGNVPVQFFTLGFMFAGLGFVYQALLAIFSANARRVITKNEFVQTTLRAVSGSVLLGFGVKLALERQTT
ncbi:LysE family translocator [Halocatena halophila]|uniref:LysE family translocator n=1 Tax=Halocatena halophila TaxID=2814576 RepID=UPI002ED2E3C0